jgi:hypothetical protein
MARDTIFISHATPEDNDFVRWLGARLRKRISGADTVDLAAYFDRRSG